ncbi:hypothetical protein [Crocinitomix catalasitica]|uniref:hypothetical protein n=1 Tax=Crocinitomix catalasitica TaxID=184607 RepID=UPI000489CE28|nr:hypothetical protein [Crocinitomix catalasitica]
MILLRLIGGLENVIYEGITFLDSYTLFFVIGLVIIVFVRFKILGKKHVIGDYHNNDVLRQENTNYELYDNHNPFFDFSLSNAYKTLFVCITIFSIIMYVALS